MALRLLADDLACERSGRPVFAGIAFSLDPGGALVLTGRNGTGKSSLLMILAGLLAPTAGRLVLEAGEEAFDLPEQAHYVGHRDALKPSLTALEVLGFWQAMLGRPHIAPDAALERFGLAHARDLPCAFLSAGQRRRLALARLIVARRPLWLLDEPTSALDDASQALVATIMAEHLAAGGMIVAATHAPLALAAATALRLGSA